MNFEQYRGKKVLLIGIGGGGDVVGTLPTYFHLERLGAYPIAGGLSWKRKRHDSEGRPRRIDEFRGIERYNEHVGIVNPNTELIDGSPQHIEAHVAELLGKPVLTLDVSGMTRGTERSVKDYIQREKIDLLIGIDVGGDALCLGHEPTIRSPLADQIMLGVLSTTNSVLGVFGLGSDGELPLENFYERFSDLRDLGGYIGALAHLDQDMQKVKPVFAHGKTECSAHAFRVAEKWENKKDLI